jgi:hypothetical protein
LTPFYGLVNPKKGQKMTSIAPLSTGASQQGTQVSKNKEPVMGTNPDHSQGDSPPIPGEIVNLSDTSLKLSAAAPAGGGQTAPLANKEQARQALNKLIAGFQSDPSKALAANSNLFSSTVKSLLG